MKEISKEEERGGKKSNACRSGGRLKGKQIKRSSFKAFNLDTLIRIRWHRDGDRDPSNSKKWRNICVGGKRWCCWEGGRVARKRA